MPPDTTDDTEYRDKSSPEDNALPSKTRRSKAPGAVIPNLVVSAHAIKSTQDGPEWQGIWVSFGEVELASWLKVPILGARRALEAF